MKEREAERVKRDHEVCYDYDYRFNVYRLDFGEVVKPHEPHTPLIESEALIHVAGILTKGRTFYERQEQKETN